MKKNSVIRVFGWLLWRDLFAMKKVMIGKVIDAIIWATVTVVVTSFILPAFGIHQRFGLIVWIGSIATLAFFETIYEAQDLVADKDGNYHTGYLLTLPIPSAYVFIKMACSIAINNMVLSIFILPLGKLILGDEINLAQMSVVKFLLIFMAMNLFFGFFAVWIFGWAKNPTRFSTVRRRLTQPLWQFGGFQFTWFVLYQTFPRIAIINLLNPLTYAFEGLRAAVLGPEGFIPFWISFGMLCVFSVIFAWWGQIWLKKRLDFV